MGGLYITKIRKRQVALFVVSWGLRWLLGLLPVFTLQPGVVCTSSWRVRHRCLYKCKWFRLGRGCSALFLQPSIVLLICAHNICIVCVCNDTLPGRFDFSFIWVCLVQRLCVATQFPSFLCWKETPTLVSLLVSRVGSTTGQPAYPYLTVNEWCCAGCAASRSQSLFIPSYVAVREIAEHTPWMKMGH